MKRLCILIAGLLSILFIFHPLPAKADGGPMVDPDLFAKLKEGQQVGVIMLQDKDTAIVDLFVSILDQSGTSHDVVFFVPLGIKASDFSVQEQDSFAFNDALTNKLDMAIFTKARTDARFVQALFAGALLSNGVWLTPLWLPFLFTGCAEAPPPVSTFKTESSQVSIFGLDESTDLEALISTTGLAPAVLETLSRLRGQQIAVVNLHTKPQSIADGIAESETSSGEPGLHLSWTTNLNLMQDGATYTYPLGTGAAWAHPIEMTRIYIIAPEELEFTVQYPKLGRDRSGFVRKQSSWEPRIADSGEEAAYAVGTASGISYYPLHMRVDVWRIIYSNSNSAEDILVTVNQRSGSNIGADLRQRGPEVAFLVGIVVAALFWILAWWLLMPRLLGRERMVKGLWRFALTYIGWNALLFLPGGILYFIFSFGEQALVLLLAVLLFGGVSVLVFALRHLNKLGVSTSQGIRVFIIITLVSNCAYFLFVLGYASLVGAV